MYVLIGLVLIAGGIAAIVYLRKKLMADSLEMKALQTSTVADLIEAFQSMDDTGLGDNYRHFVELKGTISVDQLAQTPYSEKEVAYYQASLSQVYEERVTTRDKEGNTHSHMEKKERKISSEVSSEPVKLTDSSSGESVILDVNSHGVQLDLVKSFDRFENTNQMRSYRFYSSFQSSSYGSNTLGYRMVENTLSQGQAIYVIGEAYRRDGQLYIGKPGDSSKPFIVSHKSEEEVTQGKDRNALYSLIGGIAAIVGGIGAIIYAFVK